MSTSPFEFFSKSEYFHELYEVIKTAELVHNDDRFRIDVLLCHSNKNQGPYTARVYKQKKIDGIKFGSSSSAWQEAWMPFNDLPAIHDTTENGALQEALSWLWKIVGEK